MKQLPKILSFLIGITITIVLIFALFFLLQNLTTFSTATVSFISVTTAVTAGNYTDETLSSSKDKATRLKSALFKGVLIGLAVSLINWSS